MTHDSAGDRRQHESRLTRRDFNRLVAAFGATVACGILTKAVRAGEPVLRMRELYGDHAALLSGSRVGFY